MPSPDRVIGCKRSISNPLYLGGSNQTLSEISIINSFSFSFSLPCSFIPLILHKISLPAPTGVSLATSSRQMSHHHRFIILSFVGLTEIRLISHWFDPSLSGTHLTSMTFPSIHIRPGYHVPPRGHVLPGKAEKGGKRVVLALDFFLINSVSVWLGF